jgi:Protein of unknown function (DUF3892)
MATLRIVCIRKQPTHQDTHHHITHVGIGSDSDYSVLSPVANVIANLKSATGDRYYVLGTGGARSAVIVRQCPHCAHAPEIITTTPDWTKSDNLLSLPECS